MLNIALSRLEAKLAQKGNFLLNSHSTEGKQTFLLMNFIAVAGDNLRVFYDLKEIHVIAQFRIPGFVLSSELNFLMPHVFLDYYLRQLLSSWRRVAIALRLDMFHVSR